MLAPVAGTALGCVVGLAGKARDMANMGLTWGEKSDTPSKRPTVRNDERMSHIMMVCLC